MDEPRSAQARARAELALVRFLHELGDHDPFLVVLGGLVPEVLAGDETTVDHLGTTDVDMLLITHVHTDADLGPVESALKRMHFDPAPNDDGWRWRGPVDGTTVTLEFLCDLPDHPEGEVIRPQGCTDLAAANLRGTGYVAHDYTQENLSGTLPDGTAVSVRARFAGLQGYLLSKCVAARTRGVTKDYYDLVYVLQHNRLGGPEQAAAQLLSGDLAGELAGLRTTFIEIRERYGRTADIGPTAYAEQALQVDPTADAALLRADAVDVVQRFIASAREDSSL